MKNNIIIGVVGVLALLGAVAFFGYSPFIKTIESFSGVNLNGSASTAKTVVIPFAPSAPGATTTSSAINTDGVDRFVTGTGYQCSGIGTSYTAYSGAGLKALTFQLATSSGGNPASLTNTNYIFNGTIATASAETQLSTATTSSAVADWFRWSAGAALTVQSNATNTAQCVIWASYVQGLGV